MSKQHVRRSRGVGMNGRGRGEWGVVLRTTTFTGGCSRSTNPSPDAIGISLMTRHRKMLSRSHECTRSKITNPIHRCIQGKKMGMLQM